jgi:hypothetical protein
VVVFVVVVIIVVGRQLKIITLATVCMDNRKYKTGMSRIVI